MNRVIALTALGACVITAASCSSSGTQSVSDFPSKTVTITVPNEPGGAADTSARAIAKCMDNDLGETVVVEYKPGASGAVAYEGLKHAKPDGHDLVLGVVPTFVLNYATNDEIKYRADDFKPAGLVSIVPSALIVPASSSYKTIKDFVQAAKESPGGLTVGTPGATGTHAAEVQRLIREYDVPVTIVPFDGNSQIHPALLGGNIDAAFINTSPDTVSEIDSDKERALAVGSEERLDYIDAPTLKESGYAKLTNSSSTYFLAGPKETPDSVVNKLEDTLRDCSSDRSVKKALDNVYDIDGEFLDSDGVKDLLDEQDERFADFTFER